MIENATGDTWHNVRHELDRMHLITLATDPGRVAQRSATTPGQRTLLKALDLPEPPRFFDFASVPAANPARIPLVVTRPNRAFSASPQLRG